ncbi:MAG: hypothetical protein JKY92_09890 [Magnetovibrio sp.]|nr:hypothetical protein [Magnetovibrio sp.]
MRIQSGWRVQRRVGSNRCRLLDPLDIQRQVGTERSLLHAMTQKIDQGIIPRTPSHAVVLIHGLGRSNHSLSALAKAFRNNGYAVIDFNYASCQGTIDVHAKALAGLLNEAGGITKVDFVTHSLGAIVLRHALNQKDDWQHHMELGRAVFLAPPNQGSAVARMLTGYKIMDVVLGPTLKQLADPKLGEKNPMPIPFATITGTVNWLPFLTGMNDGLVREEETQLKGEVKHIILKVSHAFCMNDKNVIAETLKFLAPGAGKV